MAAIKLLDGGVSLGLIVFSRAFLFLPLLLVWLHNRGRLRASLKTSDPLGHIIRGLIGGMGMLVWFSAIQRLPLPSAQAIAFAGPLMAVVLAILLLGEKVYAFRWSAVTIGFVGIVILLSEHLTGQGAAETAGAVLALIFALLSALASIQIRRLTGSESTETIVIYFSYVTTVFGLMLLPFGWEMPNGRETLLLVFIGIAGGAAQIMLTQALRHCEASILAPFEYFSMIWVTIMGFVLFGDIPTITTTAGSVIIIAAGTAVILRERYLHRRVNRARGNSEIGSKPEDQQLP